MSIRSRYLASLCFSALAVKAGFEISEMEHSRKETICCGEVGAVGFVDSQFSNGWGVLRKIEAGDRRLLTYCAGCAGFLNGKTPTGHILDAVYDPDGVTAGKRKAAKAPLTYFNRIRLKRYLQKKHPAAITRERTFIPGSGVETAIASAESGRRKLIFLVIIIAVIAGLRGSGLLENFDSVVDLLKGSISPAFVIGTLLIVQVSLIPVVMRKIRPAQEKDLELL